MRCKIVHRAELDHDLAFALAEADRHPGVEGTREPLGDILQPGHLDRLAPRRRRLARARSRLASVTASSVARTDSPSATIRAASSSCASAPPSSDSSARAWPADSTPAATRRCTGDRQAQQPDHVGDQRTGPADPGREFVVGDVELVEQLLIGRRLFQRVQLRAVDVLQQRVAQQVVVGGLAHDRRDGGQAGLSGPRASAAPPSPVGSADRSASAPQRADHDRLHQAELADRVHEFGERLLVEHLPRLPRVRLDVRPDRSRGRPRRCRSAAPPAWAADHHVGGRGAHPRPAQARVRARPRPARWESARPGRGRGRPSSRDGCVMVVPFTDAGRPRSASSRLASR